MNDLRLKQLIEFYNEDPNDPFIIYALANEYKSFNPKKALYYFELLLKKFPNYVPTYYHLAQLYLILGNDDLAKSIFESGISIATKMNDDLALREIKNAYNEFMTDQ